jgi:HlyD family secretion protein
LFEGKILQVRMNSTTTQNVVTYPVVVTAANPELKLLPGMTANLSFHVEKREDAVKIPNAALRFYPERRLVRPEDHKLLDATEEKDAEPQDSSIASQPAEQRVSARRNRNRRHVWVKDADHLRAIEVRTGLGDYKYTELVEGDVKPGQKLVTGVK